MSDIKMVSALSLVSFFRDIANGRSPLIYAAKPHWMAMFAEFKHMLMFLAATLCYACASAKLTDTNQKTLLTAAFLLVLFFLFWTYFGKKMHAVEDYGNPFGIFITRETLVAIEGRELLSRPALMDLDDVEDIDVRRSFLGRLLGYGSVMIKQRGKEIFDGPYRFIKDPEQLISVLCDCAPILCAARKAS